MVWSRIFASAGGAVLVQPPSHAPPKPNPRPPSGLAGFLRRACWQPRTQCNCRPNNSQAGGESVQFQLILSEPNNSASSLLSLHQGRYHNQLHTNGNGSPLLKFLLQASTGSSAKQLSTAVETGSWTEHLEFVGEQVPQSSLERNSGPPGTTKTHTPKQSFIFSFKATAFATPSTSLYSFD